jgi:predicted secreted hydrolase
MKFWPLCLCLSGIYLAGCGQPGDTSPVSDRTLLSQSSGDYPQAAPGNRLLFPRDHGENPDYRIEWWYLTANLQDPQGQHYGVQFTLFRFALTPPSAVQVEEQSAWANTQLYMGHAALTTPRQHFHAERFSRGGVGLTEIRAEPFVARIEQWKLTSTGDTFLPVSLQAGDDKFAMELSIAGDPVPALHGQQGFSQKHPTKQVGSYYYSLPHLTVSGRVRAGEQWQQVQGQAWLDREWSSQYLADDQQGWDWLSLHLQNNKALMAFRLRMQDGSHYLYGSLIDADGRVQTLSEKDLQFEPVGWEVVAGRRLPLEWRVQVPSMGISRQIRPLHSQQWMETQFPYWEGAVLCQQPDECRGYLELTGYASEH